jgi:hypothetical protein
MHGSPAPCQNPTYDLSGPALSLDYGQWQRFYLANLTSEVPLIITSFGHSPHSIFPIFKKAF